MGLNNRTDISVKDCDVLPLRLPLSNLLKIWQKKKMSFFLETSVSRMDSQDNRHFKIGVYGKRQTSNRILLLAIKLEVGTISPRQLKYDGSISVSKKLYDVPSNAT